MTQFNPYIKRKSGYYIISDPRVNLDSSQPKSLGLCELSVSVLKNYYGIGCHAMSLRKVGEVLGLSYAATAQLLRKALREYENYLKWESKVRAIGFSLSDPLTDAKEDRGYNV